MTNLDKAVDHARTLLKSLEFGSACFKAGKEFNVDSAEIARVLASHSAMKRKRTFSEQAILVRVKNEVANKVKDLR
jgi:hypothetical protein